MRSHTDIWRLDPTDSATVSEAKRIARRWQAAAFMALGGCLAAVLLLVLVLVECAHG